MLLSSLFRSRRTASRAAGRRAAHGFGTRKRPPRVPLQLERLEDRTVLNAGALDPSFGAGGKVQTLFPDSNDDAATTMVVQSDGKTILAGNSDGIALARYNLDGSLDTTFGTAGRLIFRNTPGVQGPANPHLALLPSGKIVVAATEFGSIFNTGNTDGDFSLWCLNSNGSLDTTFGIGGHVRNDLHSFSDDELGSVAIDASGNILVAGTSVYQDPLNNQNQVPNKTIVRYRSDGNLDSTFGANGIVEVSTSSPIAPPSLVIDTNGKILLGSADSLILRFNSDGTLDSTFGTNGAFSAWASQPSVGSTFESLALESDRTLIATGSALYGSSGTSVFVDHLSEQGTLLARVELSRVFNQNPIPSAVTVQPNGDILLVAMGDLSRFHSDLTADTSFGASGGVHTGLDTASAVALSSGNILVAGARVFIGFSGSIGGIFRSDFALERYNASGALDTGFATGGMATTDFVTDHLPGTAGGVAIQQDGKIVTAGVPAQYAWSGGGPLEVARYMADGTLDLSFGSGGRIVASAIPFNKSFKDPSVVIQPDGKILVGGTVATIDEDTGWTSHFAVVRFNPSGDLDTSFGSGGVVTTVGVLGALDPQYDYMHALQQASVGRIDGNAYSLALQSNGKILIAGQGLTVVRLTSDGRLDTDSASGFGPVVDSATGRRAGFVSTPLLDDGYSVVVQADGRILVAGTAPTGDHYSSAFVRYNSDGTLDSSFNGSGELVTDFGLSAPTWMYDVVIQPSDQKIIAMGGAYVSDVEGDEILVVRLNTDGSLDGTFGTAGTSRSNYAPGSDDQGFALVLQPDHKIVVAGTTNAYGTPDVFGYGQTYDFAVLRYNADGTPDQSFGQDGKVTTNFTDTGDDVAFGVAVQANGDIVVSGGAGPFLTTSFALARYTGQDGDGVPATVEDAAPNGGDGNADGIPDSQQDNVTSLPDSADGSYVTVAAPTGTSLATVEAVPNPAPNDAPAGVTFPVGHLSFSVEGVPTGGVSTVTIFLPSTVSVSSYYKYGPTADNSTSHWYEFLYDGTTGAEIDNPNHKITLHFVDGGRGDDDLTANGRVVDPGSPVLSRVASVTTVTASVNPSLLNQAVTFTATVSPQVGSGTPTGTVQFVIDSANFGSPVALSNGTASITTATLMVGPHTIQAVYGGASGFFASTGSLTQNVQYKFGGFQAPLSNNLLFNQNRTIPIKWQLKDAAGKLITSFGAVTSLQVAPMLSGGGLGTPFNPGATGGTALRNDGVQYVFNWDTKNVAVGTYKILLSLADGTVQTKTLQIVTKGGYSGLLIDDATVGIPSAGGLLGGDVALFVDNSAGLLTADELARIDDAVAAVDAVIGEYGVTITEVTDSSLANVTLDAANTSAVGGYADGVLGCTTDAGEITLIQGWNWYAGADAAGIGSGQYDFETVVVHELGHALGLGHSSDAASVMYATLGIGAVNRALVTADLNVADTDPDGADGLHAAPSPDNHQTVQAFALPETRPFDVGLTAPAADLNHRITLFSALGTRAAMDQIPGAWSLDFPCGVRAQREDPVLGREARADALIDKSVHDRFWARYGGGTHDDGLDIWAEAASDEFEFANAW